MWTMIRRLTGLDEQVKVPASVNAFTAELVAGREAELVYETIDEATLGLSGFENGDVAVGDAIGEIRSHERGLLDPAANTRALRAAYAVLSGLCWAMRQAQTASGAMLYRNARTDANDRGHAADATDVALQHGGGGHIRFGDVDEVVPCFGDIDEVLPAIEAAGAIVAPEAPPCGRQLGDEPPARDHQTAQKLRKRKKSDVARMVRLASAAARAKFGLPKATEANLLVVGKFIRDWLEDYGMRPTHIAGIAPLATSLTFIPSRSDVLMRQMLASEAAINMTNEHNAAHYSVAQFSWLRPSTWLGLGRAYARPFAG